MSLDLPGYLGHFPDICQAKFSRTYEFAKLEIRCQPHQGVDAKSHRETAIPATIIARTPRTYPPYLTSVRRLSTSSCFSFVKIFTVPPNVLASLISVLIFPPTATAYERRLQVLKGLSLMLSDGEKVTLAELAYSLGRMALEDVAATAKPNTILGWYRKLIANKFNGSRFRK